jgi:site-specific DNA-methyltransferase (adenine-specific)
MIEPYYEKDGITIYHGDCAEVAGLGRFDLLLTDPPYGIDAGNMNLGAHNQLKPSDWDKQKPAPWILRQMIQRSDKSTIWGGNYFELKPSRQFLIWDKTPEMEGRSFAECEMAWCSWDAVSRIYRYPPTQMKKLHKTQKPLPLMQWCIKQAGDVSSVLDPFMGSGTTLVAAKLAGMTATGIEREERYCEIAAKRLAQGVFAFDEVPA